MASLNKVMLIGNLTRDPELRYTQNGSAVCEIGMAINRTYMSNNEKKEDVCFVDVNVWGRQAEACSRYLKKGAPLFVEGRLNFDQWTDKESGKTRSRLRVVAERTQFLSGGRNEGDDMGDSYGNSGSTNNAQQFTPPPVAPNNNPGTFPSPPPPQQFGVNPQPAAPTAAGMPTQPPAHTIPASAPVTAPPASMAPSAPQQQQEAFNPNLGSEDDIPF